MIEKPIVFTLHACILKNTKKWICIFNKISLFQSQEITYSYQHLSGLFGPYLPCCNGMFNLFGKILVTLSLQQHQFAQVIVVLLHKN